MGTKLSGEGYKTRTHHYIGLSVIRISRYKEDLGIPGFPVRRFSSARTGIARLRKVIIRTQTVESKFALQKEAYVLMREVSWIIKAKPRRKRGLILRVNNRN